MLGAQEKKLKQLVLIGKTKKRQLKKLQIIYWAKNKIRYVSN